jgi:hypothetical protein
LNKWTFRSSIHSKPHLPLGMRNFYTMGAKYLTWTSHYSDIQISSLCIPILVVGVSDFSNFIRVCNNAISEAMLSCFILFLFISSLTVLFARLCNRALLKCHHKQLKQQPNGHEEKDPWFSRSTAMPLLEGTARAWSTARL